MISHSISLMVTLLLNMIQRINLLQFPILLNLAKMYTVWTFQISLAISVITLLLLRLRKNQKFLKRVRVKIKESLVHILLLLDLRIMVQHPQKPKL